MPSTEYDRGLEQGRNDVIECLPDHIDIYRAIKKSKARSIADIAKVVSDLYVINEVRINAK